MNTRRAALYLAGRFHEAIRILSKASKGGGESFPQDWTFLALAHHRLGHRAEALRWLDRFRTYRANENSNSVWNGLEIRLLRSESEAELLHDAGFPVHPFASPL